MIAILFLAGLGLLSLPSLLRRCGRRVHPKWWALSSTVALVLGLVLVLGTGAVGSLPSILWMAGLPQLARACERMLGYSPSVAPFISLGTLALTSSMMVRGVGSLRRFHDVASRSWLESIVGQRLHTSDQYEVVVLDSPFARAHSVPGRGSRTGQVHLTTGLINALAPEELELVQSHEEAHLILGHHRFLAIAVMVEGSIWFWPPAMCSTGVLRLSIERWADETAAGESMSLRTSLASALFAVAVETQRPALAAFSALDGLVERVSAMQYPERGKWPMLWWPSLLIPSVLLATASLYGLTRLGASAYCLVSMPSHCPFL